MNEEIEKNVPEPEAVEVKEPTAQDIKYANQKLINEARAAAQKKLSGRVAELKGFEGKTFRIKNPSDKFNSQVVTVLRYAGVASVDPTGKSDPRNVVSAHMFEVESFNPNARWTPIASKFLEDYEQIKVSEKPVNQEVI